MANTKQKTPEATKFQVVYEDDEGRSIWTYNTSVRSIRNGPVSVEIQYAKSPIEKKTRAKKNKSKG